MQPKLLFIVLAAQIFFLSPAASQLYVGGEFRPRTEFRHGFHTLMTPEAKPAFFTSQRARLNLSHSQSGFSVGFSLQDVRVWGEVPQLARTGMNTTVHQAWAEVRLSEHAALKAGRQEIIYDDHRMFGNVGWAQQGRSHDAAILKWDAGDDMTIHGGFAFNQQAERITGTTYEMNNYKAFQYLWLNKIRDDIQVSLLFLNNGWQYSPDNTVFSQTTGGRVVYSPGNYSLSGSAYIQSGRDAANRNLSAHYLAAELSQPLYNELTLQTGFELLSGTNEEDMADAGHGTNNSFNPLYGTNHRFNGHMDYFYVGNHLNDVGLRDFYGGLVWDPGWWSAGFRLHVFASDALLNDPANQGETLSRYLGTEIDLYFGLQMYERAALRVGYSQMFASGSMEVLKGGSRKEINNWAWVMLVLNPVFFE